MSRRLLDPALAALLRACRPLLGNPLLVEARSTAWASATFVGGRHLATLAPGDASAPFDAGLPSRLMACEFDLPGLLVADIVAALDDGMLNIEALILEAA